MKTTELVLPVRERILAALLEKLPDPDRPRQKVRVAYTVHALARKVVASPSKVETELRSLVRAGKVVVRTTRANDVLYKLADRNDGRWAASNGLDAPSARRQFSSGVLVRRSRKLGGRHIHITGWF